MSNDCDTRLAGVMGWPIRHSLSPLLHNFWFKRYSLNGHYIPLAVHPEDFADAFRALPKLGFSGVNITVPHKERAFELVDERDSVAERMGAVNTVVIDDRGRMRGLNTDGFGFLASLREQVGSWRADAGPAVLIGTGGAARAIAVALRDAGVPELVLVNRTRARAEKLAAELGGGVRVADWQDRDASLADAALLVNCTSLGMVGHGPLQIDLAHLPRTAAVVDIVYRPLRTPLLASATGRGHPTADGLGMLLHQATPGFAHWGGVTPAIDAATRQLMGEALGEG